MPRMAEEVVTPGLSWGAVKDGKWHVTVSANPSWQEPEQTACGLTIRPYNVTHGTVPPTNEHYICRKCLSATAKGA